VARRDGPTVVDVVVDKYALSLPAHVPFDTARDFTLGLAKQVLAGRGEEVVPTVMHNTGLV
jgi:pyruvate dehydrogenase (quinone)